jgi:hypothetical protein
MGENAAPELANLTLYVMERDYVCDLMQRGQLDEARKHAHNGRYIDDCLFGPHFPDCYPPELPYSETTLPDGSVIFLGAKITPLADGRLAVSVFNKTAEWNIPIRRYTHGDSNAPRHQFIGIITGQVQRYWTICNSMLAFKQATTDLVLQVLSRKYSVAAIVRGWKKFVLRTSSLAPQARLNLTSWFRSMLYWANAQPPQHTTMPTPTPAQQSTATRAALLRTGTQSSSTTAPLTAATSAPQSTDSLPSPAALSTSQRTGPRSESATTARPTAATSASQRTGSQSNSTAALRSTATTSALQRTDSQSGPSATLQSTATAPISQRAGSRSISTAAPRSTAATSASQRTSLQSSSTAALQSSSTAALQPTAATSGSQLMRSDPTTALRTATTSQRTGLQSARTAVLQAMTTTSTSQRTNSRSSSIAELRSTTTTSGSQRNSSQSRSTASRRSTATTSQRTDLQSAPSTARQSAGTSASQRVSTQPASNAATQSTTTAASQRSNSSRLRPLPRNNAHLSPTTSPATITEHTAPLPSSLAVAACAITRTPSLAATMTHNDIQTMPESPDQLATRSDSTSSEQSITELLNDQRRVLRSQTQQLRSTTTQSSESSPTPSQSQHHAAAVSSQPTEGIRAFVPRKSRFEALPRQAATAQAYDVFNLDVPSSFVFSEELVRQVLTDPNRYGRAAFNEAQQLRNRKRNASHQYACSHCWQRYRDPARHWLSNCLRMAHFRRHYTAPSDALPQPQRPTGLAELPIVQTTPTDYTNQTTYLPEDTELTTDLAARIRHNPNFQAFRVTASQLLVDDRRRAYSNQVCSKCLLQCDLGRHRLSGCNTAIQFRRNVIAAMRLLNYASSPVPLLPAATSTAEASDIRCATCNSATNNELIPLWCNQHWRCYNCFYITDNTSMNSPALICTHCQLNRPRSRSPVPSLFQQERFTNDCGVVSINAIIRSYPASQSGARAYIGVQDVRTVVRANGDHYQAGAAIEVTHMQQLLQLSMLSALTCTLEAGPPPHGNLAHISLHEYIFAYIVYRNAHYYAFIRVPNTRTWSIYDSMYHTDGHPTYNDRQLQFLLGFAQQSISNFYCNIIGVANRQRCFNHNTSHDREDFASTLCPEGIHLLCDNCVRRMQHGSEIITWCMCTNIYDG